MIEVDHLMQQRLRETRESRGLTQQEVADRLGVSNATVQRWESGQIKTIKQRYISEIAKMFDCSPGYLLGWEEEETPFEEKYVYPILGRIPAGVPINAVEYREGTIEVPKSIVERFGKTNIFALKINGDSMNKIIAPDTIGIFFKTEDANNNSLVAVSINGDDATLKRYTKMDNFVILRPESINPEHEIKTYDIHNGSNFKILGVLIATMKMFI